MQSSHRENIFLFTLSISSHIHTSLTLHDCGLQNTDLTKIIWENVPGVNYRKDKNVILLGYWLQKNFFQEKIILDLYQRYKMQLIFPFTNLHLLNSTDTTDTQQHHTSKLQTLARDGEGLTTKQHTPKQIILGMVLHKMTGMNSFCFNLFPALVYPWL